MSDQIRRLHEIVAALEERGVDVGTLHALEEELAQIEEPPGLFSRVSRQVSAFATRQWGHLMGELEESQEAFGLLTRRLGGEPLSEEEQAALSEQLADLMRAVPAGALVLAVEAIPLPGTSAVTPWLLSRLGLLPSRWREAHLLEQLRAESGRLRAADEAAAAARIDALITAISEEAIARDTAAHAADMASLWDLDGDGVLGEEERAAYELALAAACQRARGAAAQRRWYLRYQGQVFGPVRLSELRRVEHEAPLLVSFEGQGGWVELELLLERLDQPPP